jgi:hypothetical protein
MHAKFERTMGNYAMLKGMEFKTTNDYGKKQDALFQRLTLNASIAQSYIIISTTFGYIIKLSTTI